MPAGDLIAANLADLDTELAYQAEMGGHLIGDADPWVITALDGLGDVENTPNTVPRSLNTGMASGVHFAAPGGIVFTAMPHELADADAVEEEVLAVTTAWTLDQPAWDPMQLHLLAPHHGHIYVVGWPHTVKVNRLHPAGGVASIVCAFLKTELAVYPVPEVS